MRILPCGDAAVLLDCESLDEAQGWYAALEDSTDAVLGAHTVVLRGSPAELRALVATTTPETVTRADLPEIEVPVTYDGEDLAEVCALTGLGSDAVIAAHTGLAWTVAFGGFAPGFAYLTGGDRRLIVPRRDSPRSMVPAGSVGLAGEFSGIYPRPSPGGWQLIGRTALPMWNLQRDPPAILRPGARVRFVALR